LSSAGTGVLFGDGTDRITTSLDLLTITTTTAITLGAVTVEAGDRRMAMHVATISTGTTQATMATVTMLEMVTTTVTMMATVTHATMAILILVAQVVVQAATDQEWEDEEMVKVSEADQGWMHWQATV